MKELQTAMKKADDHPAMLEHIANIQLLTDLFLETNTREKKTEQDPTSHPVTPEQVSKQTSVTSAQELDGTSIFDF